MAAKKTKPIEPPWVREMIALPLRDAWHAWHDNYARPDYDTNRGLYVFRCTALDVRPDDESAITEKSPMAVPEVKCEHPIDLRSVTPQGWCCWKCDHVERTE